MSVSCEKHTHVHIYIIVEGMLVLVTAAVKVLYVSSRTVLL